VNAKAIREHFLGLADWVDPATTVDRVIIGDPEREVRRVLVTWIASFRAVRAAVRRGCDLVMTHEPTFWAHANELETMESSPLAAAKRRFIEESGLVVLRNHDVWDRMPAIGIPWAWARFLGLGSSPAAIGASGYQHRYDIEPVTFEAFAQRVARCTASLGEPWVQAVGEARRNVSRVGIGTGCGCDIRVFQEMGCDVSIVCDDGSCYWSGIQRAADADHPVIRVNHGTSEEPGMVTLADYIKENLPGVEAEHLPHGSSFRLVGSA
jgi:putative NIF3 family GTP cyclohydrolase 1 type 2